MASLVVSVIFAVKHVLDDKRTFILIDSQESLFRNHCLHAPVRIVSEPPHSLLHIVGVFMMPHFLITGSCDNFMCYIQFGLVFTE